MPLRTLYRLAADVRSLASLMTALPLGGGSLEAAARAFWAAPIVGWLEGVLAASVLLASVWLGLSPIGAGAVYTIAHVMITGGIHLDGLADYSDVLGARARGERAVRIMKDPRKGSFAATSLALALIASAIFAGELASCAPTLQALAAITAVYSSSAASMFLVLSSLPPEPYEGMARAFSRAASNSIPAMIAALSATMIASTAIALLGGGLQALPVVFAPLPASALLAALVARDSGSRLGFGGGDVAGFAFESSRVASMLAAAVACRGIA
ncbi:MAG: adenosylcobinamide-GDP ribazoletransferase [Aeropyrum sp.]|nr:adenosylcobinamide-GDP ribazoletransferase [Aeropyrum sp.]